MSLIAPPRNILVSYHYYKRVDLDKLSGCRIVADSGAYSAKQLGVTITTNKLAAWTRLWYHRLCWVASLDVAGDVEKTRANWLRMVEVHGIPAVSTIHRGVHPSEMDWYAERGVDFLGLGGIAGDQGCAPDVQFRWMVQVFKYAQANHPQMRFHGWGLTKAQWMRLPWFSVDSSGWGSSYRYGMLALYDPRDGSKVSIRIDGRGDTYRPKVAELLINCYGVTPSEIHDAGPTNRLLLVKLSALSAAVQEQQYRKIHQRNPITPPEWGHLGAWDMPGGPNQHLALGGCGAGIRDRKVFSEMNGPHMHLVDGHPQHIETVAQLARGEAPKASAYS
jgi:hypothetical protein